MGAGGCGVFFNKRIKHTVDVTSEQNNTSRCDSTAVSLKCLQQRELLQELKLVFPGPTTRHLICCSSGAQCIL